MSKVLKERLQELASAHGLTDIEKAVEFGTAAMTSELKVDADQLEDVVGGIQANRNIITKSAEALEKAADNLGKAAETFQASMAMANKKAGEEAEVDAQLAAEKAFAKSISGGNDTDDALLGIIKEFGIDAAQFVATTNPIEKALQFSHKPDSNMAGGQRALSDLYVALIGSRRLSSSLEKGGASLKHRMSGKDEDMYKEVMSLVKSLEDQTMGMPGYDWRLARGLLDRAYQLNKSGDIIRDEAGSGAEWLPTLMSNELIRQVYYKGSLAGLFNSVPMRSKTLDVPKMAGQVEFYRADNPTKLSDYYKLPGPASTLQSDDVTFTAHDLISIVGYAKNMEDDVLFSWVQNINAAVLDRHPRMLDSVALNSCSTATGLDNAGTDGSRLWYNSDAATLTYAEQKQSREVDHRSFTDGLRQFLVGDTDRRFDASNVKFWASEANSITWKIGLAKAMAAMGVFEDGAVWVMNPKLVVMLHVMPEMVTVNTAGERATLFNGLRYPLSLFGKPIISAIEQSSVLNASGVYDATTRDRTLIHLVHPSAAMFGNRRELQLLNEQSPFLPSQTAIYAYLRTDFKMVQDKHSEGSPVVEVYNVAHALTS